MTIIRTIIILIAFCGFTRVNAQNEEKLKAQKIAFITQKLDLTPDESAKFWPLYNQMESELKSQREASKNAKSGGNMSDAEANDFINSYMKTKEQEVQIQKKHIDKFKTALPVSKVAQLLILERDFRKEMVDNIKERIKERKGLMKRGVRE